jgi:hypothetical protein
MKHMLLIHGDSQRWEGLGGWSQEDVNQQVEIHAIGQAPEV